MKTFFQSLLGSKTIVENAQRGIDAVFLTDEEKIKYFLEYLKTSMPMNVSRRFIAIAVTLFWVAVGAVQVVLILSGSEKAAELHSFAVMYTMPPFTVVIGFYFFKQIASVGKG